MNEWSHINSVQFDMVAWNFFQRLLFSVLRLVLRESLAYRMIVYIIG